MVNPLRLIRASLDVGRDFLRPPAEVGVEDVSQTRGTSPVLVPIRSLGSNHRSRIAHHLLSLGESDRYLRFGYNARDAQIQKYVDSLDFERDDIFGIYNRRLDLLAVAHLAYAKGHGYEECAEFGVSVLASARARGYGARLFERAAMHATNEGVRMMFIHALSENAPMLRIARNAGARLQRDGTESEAYLILPNASLDTRMTEMLEEQIAQTDYSLKVQAQQFWNVLGELQSIRRDAIEAQKRSAS
ncbi:MAG: GNAT family N-acetyltransferase [Burkholderiales bacterium]|nr:GNAT family N-acetyltransferase [Burkholderiales bacterium]